MEFMLLALVQTTSGVAIRPEFPACDALQTSDSHRNPQNLGLHGTLQECLVSFVRRELNLKLAFRRHRIHGVRMFFGAEALLLALLCELSKTGINHGDIG